MRTLNDYFIDGEAITGIHTDGALSVVTCVPDAGRLVGVVAHVATAATTAITTFDITVVGNGTGAGPGSGYDCSLPILANNTSAVMNVNGQVILQTGDYLRLASNGETGNTPNLYITYIIRR